MGMEMAYANLLCLCENKVTCDMICNSHDCNRGNKIFLLFFHGTSGKTIHIKKYVGISGYHGYTHANYTLCHKLLYFHKNIIWSR